ncbi:hypothetical protein [Streptococcus thoraltensis]|uniref:hypothetical protein n=1 Tax=Streptococcus thoraltensis TaxID=55085 RepID=UPI001F57684E|nr:hypothetical protein [Streptococcus thoraltensis]
MTKLPSVNVSVRINNVVEFSELVEKFNQKARELEEIAHELEHFQFQGEIENQILSDNTDKTE